MFIDYVEIEVRAGKGGDGAVAFRREKYVPKGGPAGGNGGNGGNVILKTDSNLYTLLDFNYKTKYEAQSGANGANSLKDGKTGEDIIIKVPVGTLVKNLMTDEIIIDLDKPQMTFVLAKGGRGGKGNSNFATPTNQTPRFAEKGKPGQDFKIGLELKLIADIGLVGFPNAGKSTFISVISAAKPKIADYPFTTLEPNLGIVRYKEYKSFTVADIPGIIEGASEGKGLGLQFLRHIERTRILLFLIDISSENHQKDFNILLKELKNFSPSLIRKQKIVAISKADISDEQIIKKMKKKKFRGADSQTFIISAVTGLGVNELLDYAWSLIQSDEN